MVHYSFKDVQALAKEIAHFLNDPDSKNWLDTVNIIKESFPETKEMILELLGPYVFSYTREFCEKIGLIDMVFNIPVRMMPVYIESKNPWEVVVARWRLTIQK